MGNWLKTLNKSPLLPWLCWLSGFCHDDKLHCQYHHMDGLTFLDKITIAPWKDNTYMHYRGDMGLEGSHYHSRATVNWHQLSTGIIILCMWTKTFDDKGIHNTDKSLIKLFIFSTSGLGHSIKKILKAGLSTLFQDLK